MALDLTFPASDPVAITATTSPPSNAPGKKHTELPDNCVRTGKPQSSHKTQCRLGCSARIAQLPEYGRLFMSWTADCSIESTNRRLQST